MVKLNKLALSILFIIVCQVYSYAQKNKELSFEYEKNQIIVKATVNGKEGYYFLLDTGVDPSVIDHQTALELQLPIEAEGGNASGRGDDKVQVFPTKMKISLNEGYAEEIEALTLDMTALSKKLGRKIHGILGYSFLKNKRFIIDYKNEKIVFCNNKESFQDQFSDKALSTTFFYDGEDRIPLVSLFKINDKPFIASFDTGSSLNIQMYLHRLKDLGLESIDLDNSKESSIYGAQGKKKTFETTLEGISVSERYQFMDERLTISEIKNTDQKRMGNIGNAFLENFKIGFDYLNKTLLLDKIAQCQTQNSFEQKLDEYLAPYLEMDAWSGVIQIRKNGEPLLTKAYGLANREWEIPNTEDTKFRIASISKLFTEVAILKLVEDGKLSLNNRLDQFIPDYPRGNEITVKNLLNHTSGIPHLNSFPNYDALIKFSYTIDDIIALFKSKELDFEPGAKYSYSNSGYVLLAYIIEKRSGKIYAEYLDENIWKPLGFKNTGIDNNKQILKNRAAGYQFDFNGDLVNADYVNMDIKIGGGSLYSTISDVSTFVEAVINKKIITKNLNELPNYGESDGQSYFAANGRVQGFCHQVTHWIDEKITITVLGNHYSNVALPISGDIYKIYKGQAYQIPENYLALEKSVEKNRLKKYEGTYDFGFGPIGVVKVVGNKLTYTGPGNDDYDVLTYIGDDMFFYKQNWVLLRFIDENMEEYKTLEWVMGENAYPAKKIKNNE